MTAIVLRRFLFATEGLPAEMQRSIEVVADFFKGAKRIKFLASIEVLKASLELGSWVPRGAVKSQSGFYQGLVGPKPMIRVKDFNNGSSASQCLRYGMPYHGSEIPTVEGVPGEVVEAWIQACQQFSELFKMLQTSRPKPVVTPVGLSPKVTKTLLEMDLDVDLSTVKEAKLLKKERQDVDRHGNLRFTPSGEPVMVAYHIVSWTPGIKLHVTRFSDRSGGCEACGKAIPSGRYVPIEAECRKLGLVGLWVGVDCARNIFGIKDQGIERTVT